MEPAQQTQAVDDEIKAMEDSTDQVEMLEEYVDSGLTQLLQTYEPVKNLNNVPVDGIPEAYAIELDRPLTYLNTGFAKAYDVTDLINDGRPLYALVCESHTPVRTDAMKKMVGVTHPNMITLLEFAIVRISSVNESRLVLFLTKPEGTPLSELMVKQKFREQQIIKSIMEPLVEALEHIHEHGFSHGRVNPSNIFVGSEIVIGEFFGEPAGYSQHHVYEPTERALCDQIGKGEPTEKTDVFALAVLAYDLLYGLARYKALDKKEYLKRCMMMGVYHVLISNVTPSDIYADFFRGALMENKAERWGFEEIKAWMDGKRFNLIAPAIQQAARSVTIQDTEYFNMRSLAYGISQNWRAAGLEMGGTKLDRWVDMMVGDSDTTDLVARLIRIGGHDGASDEQKNEMLSKIITILDSTGPLRIKHLAMNADGMGPAIANMMHHGESNDADLIMELINLDIPNFWSEFSAAPKTDQTTNTIWILQKLRALFKMDSMGFGPQRVKYDLNPSLPCQSKLLAKYCCATVEDALLALDALAANNGMTETFKDPDLAAFFGSRIGLNKEIKFKQLEKIPALADDPELKVLRIISLAQEKARTPRLTGLSTWVGLRVESMLNNIHNRRLRKHVKLDLKRAASTGTITFVLALLADTDISQRDHAGYRKATALYQYNEQRLTTLSSEMLVDDLSSNMGGRLAVVLSYLILMLTCYTTLDSLLRGY